MIDLDEIISKIEVEYGSVSFEEGIHIIMQMGRGHLNPKIVKEHMSKDKYNKIFIRK